jgi:hypothetical protein
MRAAQQDRRRDELASTENDYKKLMMEQQRAQMAEQQRVQQGMQSAFQAAQVPVQAPVPMGPPDARGNTGQFDTGERTTDPKKLMQGYMQFLSPKDQLAALTPKEKTLKEVRNHTVNGKRVSVAYYTDGSREQVEFDPDLEKAHFGSNGARTQIPMDPFSGVPRGEGLQATMSPEQADASKRGWANYGLAKNADARAAEAAKQGPAGNLVQDAEGNYVRVVGNEATPVVRNGSPLRGEVKADKPPTEFQSKAQLFGSQMAAASKVINELEGKGVGTGIFSQYGLRNAAAEPTKLFNKEIPGSEIIPRLMTTTGQQQYNQAQRQWAESYLRIKTGAAATAQEVINNIKTFFPQPGDDAATVEQKRQMRQQAEADVSFAASGKRGHSSGWGIQEVKE